jgi:hypothetical protein
MLVSETFSRARRAFQAKARIRGGINEIITNIIIVNSLVQVIERHLLRKVNEIFNEILDLARTGLANGTFCCLTRIIKSEKKR